MPEERRNHTQTAEDDTIRGKSSAQRVSSTGAPILDALRSSIRTFPVIGSASVPTCLHHSSRKVPPSDLDLDHDDESDLRRIAAGVRQHKSWKTKRSRRCRTRSRPPKGARRLLRRSRRTGGARGRQTNAWEPTEVAVRRRRASSLRCADLVHRVVQPRAC